MKRTFKNNCFKAAVLGMGCMVALAVSARADYIIDIFENAGNVVADGSGSADLTDLTIAGQNTGAAISPGFAFFQPLNTSQNYNGITGPGSMGSGGTTNASSVSGGNIGMVGAFGQLYVPVGYVSGTFTSGETIWDGTTLAGLGLTTGTYTYTWGTGPHADSLTINVGAAPVPEPSTYALLGFGALALAIGGLRKARAAKQS